VTKDLRYWQMMADYLAGRSRVRPVEPVDPTVELREMLRARGELGRVEVRGDGVVRVVEHDAPVQRR